MPICKREGFENVRSRNKHDTFQDNEEVFYCEVTNEIFRDYDDYFRHVMVINSTVWQCEATGKENLTYAEALKSERKARKTMEQFKNCLRPPVMMVIEQARQSSLNALHSIISKFLRRRFFLNETVTAYHKTYNTYKVMEIIPPGKTPPANGVYEDTEKLQYKLQRLDNPKLEVVVPFDSIRRQRTELTSENLHMFIKNNVTRMEGILRPKPESYKEYVINRKLTFSSIFIGKMPHFTPAKIKRPNEANNAKKQATLNKYLVKETEANKANAKNSAQEAAKREKERVEKAEAKAKSLKEEMERLRREKQERLAELERQRIEKRAKLMARIEVECTALLTKTDDLERTDQRLLPKFTSVQAIIPTKLLGDAFMLREFMHSFGGILSGIEVFRSNLSFYEMARAFTMREVGGPLADIVLVLLGTIFDLHREENEECTVRYLLLRKEMRQREPLISQSQATRSHFFSKRHFATPISDLPLDAQTLSEVLRLHLLSSGAVVKDRAERWRINYRNGYVSSEDPGLSLRMQHPHILRALKMYTLYQLPYIDIMRIIRCLMSQILTYANTLNLIEERMDEMAKANRDLRAMNGSENMRLSTVQAEKRSLMNKHNQKCMEDDVKNDAERKRQLGDRLNKKIAEMLAQSERDHRKHLQNVEKLQSSLFNYIVYLGMDRAYRKYYVLESMPGLFVEHPPDCMDICLAEPPTNAFDNTLSMHLMDLPRNRKDLRSYLLRHYTEEEKKAVLANKAIGVQASATANRKNSSTTDNTALLENKENQANVPLNGLVNGIAANPPKTEELSDSTVVQASSTPIAPVTDVTVPKPSQYELLMCTGDPRHCIVHDERNPDRQRWAYLYEESDIDALIESLNPLGERESALRDQLTTMRPLILNHVKKCPVDMLSVDSKQSSKFKASMMLATCRKYTNFGFSEGSDINEVMHATLIDRILQFEQEIFTGDLGRVKVKDMAKWRQDVLQNTYDAQGKLQWGPAQIQKNISITDELEKDEYYEQLLPDDDDNDALLITDAKSDGHYATIPFYDPGDGLGDTKEIDSEDSADEGISLHDSQTLRTSVRNLASALLQVEQGIERRFLKEPFGAPQKELKNKELLERKILAGAAQLKQWEVSLMECVSYSQVFLHLNMLHDAIIWARSTNKSSCQICRRGSDPDQMLLCDECNGGTHMFCMKPKMKTVPEGNWYCQRCVKNLGLKNESDVVRKKQNQQRTSSRRSNRRLRSNEIEEALEDEEVEEADEDEQDEGGALEEDEDDIADNEGDEEMEEDPNNQNGDEDDNDDDDEQLIEEEDAEENDGATSHSTNNNSEQEEDENVCVMCSYDGSEVSCTRCKSNFHLECVNLKRPPRYGFICNDCKAKDDRKRKTRHQNDSDDEDDSDTETSEPANKRTRSTRVSLRSSLTNGTSTTQQQQDSTRSSNGQRRSNRRTAEHLPLNSSVLYKLLEETMKNEKAWPFLRPVAQSQVPDYYDVIKTPMDFAKVKSKLNTGAYQLNEEVINDIQLIFENCDRYNIKGNEIYQAGAILEKFVMQRCRELNLPFNPSDMNA